MTLPCLSVLRKCYPDAHISWLVNKSIVPILEKNPLLNSVIPFDRKLYRGIQNWPLFFTFGKSLCTGNYDIAIDLQGLLRSSYLAYASGAPIRVGLAENREFNAFLYTHKVEIEPDKYHAVDWYLQILKGVPGIQLPDTITPEFTFPNFDFAKQSLNQKLQLAGWETNSPYLVFAPSTRWDTKKWLPERFAELGDRLNTEFDYKIVFIGGPEDSELGQIIQSQMKNPPVNLIGKTSLPETAVLLQQSKLMISNDTGPMHLAVGLGTPVVAIYGPTDPKFTGPYGTKHTIVRVDVPCGPCQKKICPGYNMVCMRNIPTEMVYSAALPYLK